VLYHVVLARILFVAALDQRLPGGLTRLNRCTVPSRATTIQTMIALTIVICIFLLERRSRNQAAF
jgi:amino acid transporter